MRTHLERKDLLHPGLHGSSSGVLQVVQDSSKSMFIGDVKIVFLVITPRLQSSQTLCLLLPSDLSVKETPSLQLAELLHW